MSKSRGGAALLLALLAVLLGLAAPAQAHTTLKESSPAKDATVPSPTEITLTYNDEVILPQVVLTGPDGERRQNPKATVDGVKVTQPIEGTLEPGTYTVAWRVVASDGHPITGTYTFTVEGAASPSQQPAPAPAVTATATPTAADEDDGGGNGWLWVGLVALVVVALGGGAALFRRRSGTTT